MKTSHKNILKSILLTSLVTLGTSPANSLGATPSLSITKKEKDDEDTYFSEKINSGILTNYSETSEQESHTSHSSHSSHSSHTSHSSHASSSGYSGEGSKINGKALGIGLGVSLGGAALYYIIHSICNYVNNHKKNNNSYISNNANYASNYDKYYRGERIYGSRDLKKGDFGTDVNEMIDSLVANGVIDKNEVKLSPNTFYKLYNKPVKRAVKQMYGRMGLEKRAIATKEFQLNLKDWKKIRRNYELIINLDRINLEKNKDALTAVAILLVEKGYLKKYNLQFIMSPKEKEKIIIAYHKFLVENELSISNYIDSVTLAKLYKLPTVK